VKALILTGGLGTRLRPLTEHQLKPLLPLVNLPFLNYPVHLLKKHHVREIILCTASKSEPYEKLIQTQKSLGVQISCSLETQELGTAGAIKNAEKYLDGSPFFVFNGDTLTDTDLTSMLHFHKKSKAAITIALIPVSNPFSFGMVIRDAKGKITQFIEKPSLSRGRKQKHVLINGGMYIFENEVLDQIPKGKKYSSERELFQEYIQKHLPIYGYAADPTTYWHDIGTPDKFLQASASILKGKLSGVFKKNQISPIGKNCNIHKSSVLGQNVVIGDGCRIGPASRLENCTLFNNVELEGKNNIKNCIIGNHCRIGENSTIARTPIIGDQTIIPPSSLL